MTPTKRQQHTSLRAHGRTFRLRCRREEEFLLPVSIERFAALTRSFEDSHHFCKARKDTR